MWSVNKLSRKFGLRKIRIQVFFLLFVLPIFSLPFSYLFLLFLKKNLRLSLICILKKLKKTKSLVMVGATSTTTMVTPLIWKQYAFLLLFYLLLFNFFFY